MRSIKIIASQGLSHRSGRRVPRWGLSLTELLVVMAIILVIASILLSVAAGMVKVVRSFRHGIDPAAIPTRNLA